MTEQSNPDASSIPWTRAPARLRLAPGAVHVWRADLAAATAADPLALLSDAEHARARRLASAKDRELWARSRGVLRALLGLYLQTDPRALRVETGEHGKPALVDGGMRARTVPGTGAAAATRLFFNLSHSHGTALYAFTTAGPVGVDVELARRPIDTLSLAIRAFGPAEGARLEALEPATRQQEFLRMWVRHEAVLKCLGTGLGGAGAARASDAPGAWTAALEMGARGAAAVALAGRPTELRCWTWLGGALGADHLE